MADAETTVTKLSQNFFRVTIPLEKFAKAAKNGRVSFEVARNPETGGFIPHIFLGSQVGELDSVSYKEDGERVELPADTYLNGVQSLFLSNPGEIRSALQQTVAESQEDEDESEDEEEEEDEIPF